MTRRRLLRTVIAAGALLLCLGSAVAAPQLDELAEAGAAPAVPEHVPRLAHVVVIVLENHDENAVVGSASAPAFNRFSRAGATLADYHGVSHPSLPNYLALASGSTQGITSDCTACTVRAASLADLLPPGDWKTYAEGLPAPGWDGAEAGTYVKKHDPFLYFRRVSRDAALRRRIVPLRDLSADLRTRALPRFALVIPDLCHDMHSCPVAAGDRWLARFLPRLLRSRSFEGGAAFVIFDEGVTGTRVPAFAIGPAVRPGTTFALHTDHYGLLRTIEQGLGLRPLLGHARGAQAIGTIWRS